MLNNDRKKSLRHRLLTEYTADKRGNLLPPEILRDLGALCG